MDIESLGGGAGAGLIGAILGVLGINRRMSNLEKCKQDKSVCNAIHKSDDDKFEILIKGQDKIFERLDNMNDYLRNNKK